MGFLPPLPHIIIEKLNAEEINTSTSSKLYPALAPVFEARDFEFYDYSDFAMLGATDSEAVDSFHGSERVYIKLSLSLVEKGSMLASKFDAQMLRKALESREIPISFPRADFYDCRSPAGPAVMRRWNKSANCWPYAGKSSKPCAPRAWLLTGQASRRMGKSKRSARLSPRARPCARRDASPRTATWARASSSTFPTSRVASRFSFTPRRLATSSIRCSSNSTSAIGWASRVSIS